jgi:anthranilate phosphoribosyltransferase
MYPKRYSGPNRDVLEAQARVCTGPHQTRPLGAKSADTIQPDAIFQTVLKSVRGELPPEHAASEAQMGAFFAAMTIRKYFPAETRWNAREIEAFERFRPELETELPEEMLFIMNPDCGYTPLTIEEEIVARASEKILRGKHLSYSETRAMGEAILSDNVKPALKAAALIGQRMNRETYDEVRGYLDAFLGPEQVRQVSVDSLTHFGEPFDGATRNFRPTLFIAAVRAALGEASVLHGVDDMPPKSGVTEEGMLRVLGAKTDLTLDRAGALIEDKNVGFAYVSQREYSPAAYNIRELRVHIKKRPPWAATEKAQQVFKAPGANYLVIGYYHPGYEEPLLNLAWDRGFQAALAVRGEEGTSHCTLRLGKPSTEDYMAVNYSQGFRNTNGMREDFTLDVDPQTFGFDYERNPRMDSVSPETFAEAGLAALSGEKGHVYDRIVLNTAITDFLLGICPNADEALQRTKHAITSGLALAHLRAYIEKSKLV